MDTFFLRVFSSINAEGYCSMYGICGQRSDGKVLNCPNSTRAVKVR